MDLPTVYGQRDPAWAGHQLGFLGGTSTIGNYGCYLTSFAMVATAWEHPVTPPDLDAAFRAARTYVSGNLLPDSALAQVYPDCEYVASLAYYDGPADLDHLAALVNEPTTRVIVELDFDHDPRDGVQTHFAPVVAVVAGIPVLADPWYGTVAPMTLHYGGDPATTIQKIVVYRHAPIVAPQVSLPEPAPAPADLAPEASTDPRLALLDGWGITTVEALTNWKTWGDGITPQIEALRAEIDALKARPAPAPRTVKKLVYSDGSEQTL